MLLKEKEERHIRGIKISRIAPSISHLFFADDYLFCFKANQKTCRKIREIIDLFCKVSGEAINFDKTNVILPEYFREYE